MSSHQSLAHFILGGKQQAFTSYKKTQSLVLNKATVVTNDKDGGEFALIELTDGHHWIPAISSIPVLEDGLGGQDFISQMDALRDTAIVLSDTVIGVHKRQDAFGIHLMILGCSFTRATSSFDSIDPDDICFEPSVSQWLIDLRKTFTGTPDTEWFCSLFPESTTDEYEEILNEYCIVHGDLEKILLMQYGPLPALHLSAEKAETTPKGVKRQASTMNEEDTAIVQHPSVTTGNSTSHKRHRHANPNQPVEPNKLTRLEQSDTALKNANAAVMELWNEPLTIRELHKRNRGDTSRDSEDTPMVTVDNDRSSPSPVTPTEITTAPTTTTTTEKDQSDQVTAQISVSVVNNDDSPASEEDDDDEEARFYEPLPQDPAAQKSILRSLYISMAEKFKIPSFT